jgi:hypothetical protein
MCPPLVNVGRTVLLQQAVSLRYIASAVPSGKEMIIVSLTVLQNSLKKSEPLPYKGSNLVIGVIGKLRCKKRASHFLSVAFDWRMLPEARTGYSLVAFEKYPH